MAQPTLNCAEQAWQLHFHRRGTASQFPLEDSSLRMTRKHGDQASCSTEPKRVAEADCSTMKVETVMWNVQILEQLSMKRKQRLRCVRYTSHAELRVDFVQEASQQRDWSAHHPSRLNTACDNNLR